jgi:hypothetical protein
MRDHEQASFSLAVPGSLVGSRAFSIYMPNFLVNKLVTLSTFSTNSLNWCPFGQILVPFLVKANVRRLPR